MPSFLLANFLATLYFVRSLWVGGFAPRIGTVQNTLAKRNGAILFAKAGRIYPTPYLALIFLIIYIQDLVKASLDLFCPCL